MDCKTDIYKERGFVTQGGGEREEGWWWWWIQSLKRMYKSNAISSIEGYKRCCSFQYARQRSNL
jgi:hypothetical protein